MIIEYKPDTRTQNIFLRMGVPQNLWQSKKFELEDCIRAYTSNIDGYDPARITTRQQIESIAEILDNPVRSAYTCCISSDLDDTRAKLVATTICEQAVVMDINFYWHRLMGGFYDSLLEGDTIITNPKLLIIYNILFELDNHRLSKLRDILETFNNIPRIVVTSGGDPIELFAKLGLDLTYPILLRTSKRKLLR